VRCAVRVCVLLRVACRVGSVACVVCAVCRVCRVLSVTVLCV
jgi:hypothetical protein